MHKIMENNEIRVYGIEIDSIIKIENMSNAELIEKAEKLGIIYSLDNFFIKLNNDEIDTENYYYKAI